LSLQKAIAFSISTTVVLEGLVKKPLSGYGRECAASFRCDGKDTPRHFLPPDIVFTRLPESRWKTDKAGGGMPFVTQRHTPSGIPRNTSRSLVNNDGGEGGAVGPSTRTRSRHTLGTRFGEL